MPLFPPQLTVHVPSPASSLLFVCFSGAGEGRRKGVVRPFPRCIARNHTAATKAHQAGERARERVLALSWKPYVLLEGPFFSAEERATSVAFICLRITAAVAGPAEQALFIQRRRRRRYLGKGKLGQTLEPPHLICLLCPLFHRLSILILSLPPALPLSFSPTSAPRGR